jgi:hypothetical protein
MNSEIQQLDVRKKIYGPLTDEQVKEVLDLAAIIEGIAAKLNLSMRNYANPEAGNEEWVPS